MKRTHKEKITSVLALCAGAGLFIWFCIPLFWGVFHVGNGGGILFSLFLIAGGIWYVPLRSRMEQAKHAKPLRVLRRSCWGILAVCFAWAAFLTGCMLWPTPSPSGSGTVVILGCKVGSAALQARIDAAAEYLHSYPDAVAIASGGQGDGEWISEAEAIRSGLEQHGISSGRIYLEDQSTNTNENLANSRRVIEAEGLDPTCILVTERYHMFRALQLAQQQGITAYAFPAKTPWYLLSASYGRELLALTKFFLFPWME